MAWVLKQKKGQLINDLTKGCVFGRTVAFLWVVEFQKRGLPHIHILIILADEDRPKTPDLADKIVSAELPPDPSERGISDDEKARRKSLWDIVLTNMIHGPCGVLNPKMVGTQHTRQDRTLTTDGWCLTTPTSASATTVTLMRRSASLYLLLSNSRNM